jgi:hypothetical protein
MGKSKMQLFKFILSIDWDYDGVIKNIKVEKILIGKKQ